jgi:hypothetical protein
MPLHQSTRNPLFTIHTINLIITNFRELENWIKQEKGGLLMSENCLDKFGVLLQTVGDTLDKYKANADADSHPSFSDGDLQQIIDADREFNLSLLTDIGVREEVTESQGRGTQSSVVV